MKLVHSPFRFHSSIGGWAAAGGSGANGACHLSLGQRPRSGVAKQQALKGRHSRCRAPSGLGMFLAIVPRALPWADALCPFGAAKGRPQLADSAKRGKLIKPTLKGLGYGG